MRVFLVLLVPLLLLSSCGESDKNRVSVRSCIDNNDCPANQICSEAGSRRGFCTARQEDQNPDAMDEDLEEPEQDTPPEEDLIDTPEDTEDAKEDILDTQEDTIDLCENTSCQTPSPLCDGNTLVTYNGGDTCNPETGACEPAEEHRTLCGALSCDAESATCQDSDSCTTTGCPQGLLCHEESGECQHCLIHSDCDEGEYCGDGRTCQTIPACGIDDYEPNNTNESAQGIVPGRTRPLTLCGSDEDWFIFATRDAQDVTISIDFLHAEGDLDLSLLVHGDNDPHTSESINDGESITVSLPNYDRYVPHTVRVYSLSPNPGNEYRVFYETDVCNREEHNDTPAEALTLDPGDYNFRLCQTQEEPEEDWYAVEVASGQTLSVFARSDVSTPLEIDLYDPTLTQVAENNGTINPHDVEYEATASGIHYVRITVGGFFGDYDLNETYAFRIELN